MRRCIQVLVAGSFIVSLSAGPLLANDVLKSHREEKVAEFRVLYDAMLEDQIAAAAPPGFVAKFFSSDDAKLKGAWAVSLDSCSKKLLVLSETSKREATLWTPMKSSGGAVLIPSFKGSWAVDDGVIDGKFTQHTTDRHHAVSTKPTDLPLRLNVIAIDENSLQLGIPTESSHFLDTAVAAEFLEGENQRQVVRCDIDAVMTRDVTAPEIDDPTSFIDKDPGIVRFGSALK